MRRAWCDAEDCRLVTVEFDRPSGPAPDGYVIDGPLPGDLPCREVDPGVCVVVFALGPGTCDYALRTVVDGTRGPRSNSFCIERVGED